ncbi:hypothetical protein GCM10009809_10560 [Isoptericola hypogeus]|uniref:DUF4229 domain-containing protein n=1 Tax=Isoptericola hypogeus TaxID=300179 RepID=A0ABP4V2F5_9MICO
MLYTLWRILLFAAALGAGYLLGLRSWLLVLVAAVVAFAVSYLALSRPRDSAARWLAERDARRRAQPRVVRDEDTDFEDSVVDADSGDTDPSTLRQAQDDAGSGRRGDEPAG